VIHRFNRRELLQRAAGVAAGAITAAASTRIGWAGPPLRREGPLFKISLAEWSLHRALFRHELQHLDFPMVAKRDYGIGAVEYVNQFFKDKARDGMYLG